MPCEISVVAGTRKVLTATFWPRITCAALTKSVSFPPVHEPMYARVSFTSLSSRAVARLSGECGFATVGSSVRASQRL